MANLTDVVAGKATLGDWMLNILHVFKTLGRWWKGLILVVALGGLLGFLYGLANPIKFQAEMIIAVEDDDSNGWQNLLQQFGIDVGGNNPGGIFKGDALICKKWNLVMERSQCWRIDFGPKQKWLRQRFLRISASRASARNLPLCTTRP